MPTATRTYPIRDSITMFGRSMKTTLRHPDTLVTGMFVPVLVMLLFVFVFGGAMNLGDYSVVNFIVPGMILQVLGQASTNTAIGVNGDLRKGLIDRFRSMAISKSALLNGHMLAALSPYSSVRSHITNSKPTVRPRSSAMTKPVKRVKSAKTIRSFFKESSSKK